MACLEVSNEPRRGMTRGLVDREDRLDDDVSTYLVSMLPRRLTLMLPRLLNLILPRLLTLLVLLLLMMLEGMFVM